MTRTEELVFSWDKTLYKRWSEGKAAAATSDAASLNRFTPLSFQTSRARIRHETMTDEASLQILPQPLLCPLFHIL